MKTQDFMVQGKLELSVGITIRATSLEEAVQKAKTLKETDFVTIDGDFMDGSLEIDGVFKA